MSGSAVLLEVPLGATQIPFYPHHVVHQRGRLSPQGVTALCFFFSNPFIVRCWACLSPVRHLPPPRVYLPSPRAAPISMAQLHSISLLTSTSHTVGILDVFKPLAFEEAPHSPHLVALLSPAAFTRIHTHSLFWSIRDRQPSLHRHAV